MSSTSPYRVFGADESYYTGKLEAYLRAKGITHELVPFSRKNIVDCARHTGVVQIPQIECPDGSWLELAGCGMLHPNVLRNCGLDPDEWQGFAFGFGIDRLASMRYQLDDIRELVNSDVRFLSQF